jgi:7-cyano-7-deazaguanine synthase
VPRTKRSAAKRACVLVSGGVDSGVLVADMLRRGFRVYPLYVRAGHYWESVELAWLRRYLRALRSPLLEPLAVVDAPAAGLLGRHWSMDGRGVPSAKSAWDSVYLPGRNLILLTSAGIFCALKGIPLAACAILKGNPFPDATPRFFKRMEAALREGLGFKLRLAAPYRALSKAQVARRIAGLPLHLTFSCLKPRASRHCGACNKCAERHAILAA